MLLQGQHTLSEVLAVVESQDAAVKARYSTNADTPQNKAAIKAEQAFHSALAQFIKASTKGYKGVPTAGLILDYDVSPHSVRVNLQFSASEDRTVVEEGPKSTRKSASKSGTARSKTTASGSAKDKK